MLHVPTCTSWYLVLSITPRSLLPAIVSRCSLGRLGNGNRTRPRRLVQATLSQPWHYEQVKATCTALIGCEQEIQIRLHFPLFRVCGPFPHPPKASLIAVSLFPCCHLHLRVHPHPHFQFLIFISPSPSLSLYSLSFFPIPILTVFKPSTRSQTISTTT